MATLRAWQNEINEGGNKATWTAEDLFKAETGAHAAYDARVREMTYSNGGVTPHGGNNQKMVVSELLSFLARGWGDLFETTVKEYADRASKDRARYSPVSYALGTITATLNQRSDPPRPRPYNIRRHVAPAA
jgi:hypothetical protein